MGEIRSELGKIRNAYKF